MVKKKTISKTTEIEFQMDDEDLVALRQSGKRVYDAITAYCIAAREVRDAIEAIKKPDVPLTYTDNE